jgi:O-antigen/teichoic acid export membrane protein
MYSKIKQFLKHSTIYSIGNIATKGVGVITLPIYTKFISVPEFGLFGLIEISIAILVEIFSLGQANSILLLSSSIDNKDQRKSAFFSIFIVVFIISLSSLLMFELLKAPLLNVFNASNEIRNLYTLALLVIFLKVINNLFLFQFRALEKSTLYTLVTLTKLFTVVLLVIFFVAVKKIGITGILYAYILSELLIFIVQLPLMTRQMQFRFNLKVVKTAFIFGVPLIFSSIGIMLLNLSDRYMLQLFTDLRTVGLYDLGYRIAGILNMFLIMPFSLTLLPSAYKVFKTEGDKRYYSKLMTYMCFILVWVGLALSLFSKEIVGIFALNPEYNSAFIVIPIIILSYIFSATRNLASIGMFLTKNTKYIAYITIFAAMLNILLNLLLIPKFGMMAAAYNTLISFILFHFVTKHYADKFYPVNYENVKLFKIFCVGILLYLILHFAFADVTMIGMLIKLLMVIVFPVILYFLNLFDKIEIQTLKKIFNSPGEKFSISGITKKIIGSDKN